MSKRKKEWIHIQTPENKNLIASPEYIRKLIGVDNWFGTLNRELSRLEDRIKILERPLKKKKILQLLANREKHNSTWIENRVPNMSYWLIRELLSELVSEGKLQTEKAGTQQMYSIKS